MSDVATRPNKTMSRPNRDKALKRIEKELAAIAAGAPAMRNRNLKGMPLGVEHHWQQLTRSMVRLWDL